MKQNTIFKFIGICLSILLLNCTEKPQASKLNKSFQTAQESYSNQLDLSVKTLEELQQTPGKDQKRQLFVTAKRQLKNIEHLLAYVDSESYKTISGPNLPIIMEEDITDVKVLKPYSFQVLEENLLLEEKIDTVLIHATANKLSNRLKLLSNNANFTSYNESSFFRVLRNQIVRIGTTGIAGFDSPAGNSLEETIASFEGLKTFIETFKKHFKNKKLVDKWVQEFDLSISDLENQSFETFDRYSFIKNHTHKQLELWQTTLKDWNYQMPYTYPLDYSATTLFDNNTFNRLDYLGNKIEDESTRKKAEQIGKQLFYDGNLGQKSGLSCGSCHQPELYFTDEKKTSSGNHGRPLKRNAPTLLYALLQREMFHDSRRGGLESQILEVIDNPEEFGMDLKQFTKAVESVPEYKKAFEETFDTGVLEGNIRTALAYYVATLTPFNSKFDRNITGKENTLTESEKNGFNLFTGKAACATCHFTPVFNGTVPPNFSDTELEVLGVPKELAFENAKPDTDLGRFYQYKTEERKHAFKTPTIRNIEKTAPYMHNGSFNTLEEIVRFYNVGGGHGIGNKLDNQTLPTDSLNLSEKEQTDLIHFMKSLTDDLSVLGY